MEPKYEFIVPSIYAGITADVAARELERIREKHGFLEPEFVVEESRDDGAVLHNLFVWNDEIAAELWRREQARKLIANIRVVVSNQNVEYRVRAFVNVRPAKEALRTYLPIAEAILTDEGYNDLLAQAKADMEAFVEKYRQLEELNPVKAEMMKVITFSDVS